MNRDEHIKLLNHQLCLNVSVIVTGSVNVYIRYGVIIFSKYFIQIQWQYIRMFDEQTYIEKFIEDTIWWRLEDTLFFYYIIGRKYTRTIFCSRCVIQIIQKIYTTIFHYRRTNLTSPRIYRWQVIFSNCVFRWAV